MILILFDLVIINPLREKKCEFYGFFQHHSGDGTRPVKPGQQLAKGDTGGNRDKYRDG